MAVFFTADTHFQHGKILDYCYRPFASAGEMDEVLFHNWNAVVRPGDVVYHLGDVAFGDVERLLPRLRGLAGKKRLVPGNHDNWKKLAAFEDVFKVLPHLFELVVPHDGSNLRLTLCHYAMESWNRSHCGALMLHGHTHGRLEDNSQRLDVGVDSWNFYPVRLEQVLERLKTLPAYPHQLEPTEMEGEG